MSPAADLGSRQTPYTVLVDGRDDGHPAKDAVTWMAVIFERNFVRRPGRIQLGAPKVLADGVFVAEVSFAGSDVPAALGQGADALDALVQALRMGAGALEAFRASGGHVLVDTHGSGLMPFEESLERVFRMSLRKFGLAEEPLDAAIAEGPTPDPSGHVVFKVRVGEQLLRAIASPNGVGVVEEGHDLASVNKAMSAVFRFLDQRRAETRGWYLEAARLRRLAGTPSPFRASRSPHVSLVGDPRSGSGSVIYRVQATAAELKVIASKDGLVIDHCDDWTTVKDGEGAAAVTAVLDHIIAEPEQAAALGIDVELFTALYG